MNCVALASDDGSCHMISKNLVLAFVISNMLMAGCKYKSSSNCPLPGPTIQWEYDNCLLGAGTDDAESPVVSSCVDLAPKRTESDCERKQGLKRRMCWFYLGNGLYQGTIEACMEDPHVVGAVVRAGGIGG